MVFVLFNFSFALASITDGTIYDTYKYAWGENIGWINFAPTDAGNSYIGLHITDSEVTGYAWSSELGWINFEPTYSGVTNNCSGQLGGYAWSSALGWISMDGVTINSSGKFTGMAGVEGSAAGRINFSCDQCDVRTDWLVCSARPAEGAPPGGQAGGNVTAYFGGIITQGFEQGNLVKIEFPPGAVIGAVVVRIEPLNVGEVIKIFPLPFNVRIVGDLVANFKAFFIGIPLKTFYKPVTITFTYTDEQVKDLNENTLKIYWWDTSVNQWQFLKDSQENTITNRVTATTTTHFTLFALMGELLVPEIPPEEIPPEEIIPEIPPEEEIVPPPVV